MKDVSLREISWSCRCSALSLFLGFYPKPVLDRVEPARRAASCTTSSARATTASPSRRRSPRRSSERASVERRAVTHGADERGRHRDARRRRTRSRRRRSTGSRSRRARARSARPSSSCWPGAAAPRHAVSDAGRLRDRGRRRRHRRRDRCSWQWHDRRRTTAPSPRSASMVAVDGFAVFLGVVVLIATAARAAARRSATSSASSSKAPEYVALMLFSATGMMLMTSANDLIVVFLALEILSIPLYVLAAFDRRRLSVAGSRPQVLRARRVLVGGLPLRHRARLRRAPASTSLTGIDAVPRAPTRCSSRARCWSASCSCSSGSASRSRRCRSTCGRPTCTRARPRPVTAFMASATKAAAFAALLRVFVGAFLTVPRRLAAGGLGPRRALARSSAASPRWCRPT